mgnify:CR=1 FL=1
MVSFDAALNGKRGRTWFSSWRLRPLVMKQLSTKRSSSDVVLADPPWWALANIMNASPASNSALSKVE